MAYVTDIESFSILAEKDYNVTYLDTEVKVMKEKQDFGTENFNDISYLRYNIINKLGLYSTNRFASNTEYLMRFNNYIGKQFIKQYLNPKKVIYFDPKLKPYLEQTYGILIYQDDILSLLSSTCS